MIAGTIDPYVRKEGVTKKKKKEERGKRSRRRTQLKVSGRTFSTKRCRKNLCGTERKKGGNQIRGEDGKSPCDGEPVRFRKRETVANP